LRVEDFSGDFNKNSRKRKTKHKINYIKDFTYQKI